MSKPLLHPLLRAADIEMLDEQVYVHQFNPKAIRHTKSLGDEVGLSQVGIHLVRVAPGDESTQHHLHLIEEEFIYILSGLGMAAIGNETYEVGPGDFMGFAAGSPPHSMSNPFEVDLVYLAGGDRSEVDICIYPRIKLKQYRVKNQREAVHWDDINQVVIDPPLSP